MKERIYFLDYLRVLACFMVILVHSCEFFYGGFEANGCYVEPSSGFWACAIDSALRCSVPLFVMASSYLLLPLRQSTGDFFRRRFSRVVIPFAVWSVLYVTLPLLWGGITVDDTLYKLPRLLVNFDQDGTSGHLWFIWMLIGLYLFMPVLSPWLEKVGKRGEQAFLALWFLSTFLHLINAAVGNVFGQCFWNEFHALYYFSGFVGYLVLAHYIRQYVSLSWRQTLAVAVPCLLIGYIVAAFGFMHQLTCAKDFYELELTWRFCGANIVLQTLGMFLLLKKCDFGQARIYPAVREVSRLSYGIYLMHIFWLEPVYRWLSPHLSIPATIFLVAIATYLLCILTAKLISYLPGNKYLLG